MPGEFELIEWIRSRAKLFPRVTLGIGDDAAGLSFPEPAECLIAVDTLMEGVHFNYPEMSAAQIGYKSLAVNPSDIAAMAGKPLAAVIGIVFNKKEGPHFARELEQGLIELAETFGVALIGGDTNTWTGPAVISVTILGETTGSGAVRRNGAKVGDWILATGEFGGSVLGKHFQFTPRVEEALLLHQSTELHAMIDVSDGLAADLFHILEESQVGARLEAAAIPISRNALTLDDDRSPLEHALSDGEDFELLFTVSPEDGKKLLANPPIAVPITKIGEIQPEGRYELIDENGESYPLEKSGWVHEF
jgi:thiamine-monophosphate kinase